MTAGRGSSTRRALVVQGPGEGVCIEYSPTLAPREGEVLVRPVYVGICGTDLELVSGEVDPAFVRYPVTLGHEWCGVVEEVGPACEVEGLSVGDHVVGEGIVPCRACQHCQQGASNICDSYNEIGFTREGGASDQLLVPSYLLHRLDPSVSLLDAALCEPCAVVQRALLRAAPQEGSRVLVVGDGAVGLLTAHLTRLWKPREVVLLGRRPEQASLAKAAGVTRFTTDVPEAGSGFDLVVEAAGVVEAVTTAVRAAGRGATVVLLGLPAHGKMADLPANEVVYRDLTIFGSFSYTRSAWADVVRLLNQGQIRPSAIVTHRFPLEQWARGMEALRGSSSSSAAGAPRGKVLLEVGLPDRPLEKVK